MSLSLSVQFPPAPPPPPPTGRLRFCTSAAFSSKSPSANHREDLSPTDTKVEVLVPKLEPSLRLNSYVEWKKNCVEWRQKMRDVITSKGLLGFIDGTVQTPPKTVTTSVNGPKGGNTIYEERENQEYVAWKTSDDLVRTWILKTLSLTMSNRLASLETAKDLWEEIARNEQMIRMSHYLPLYKAAINGDWKTAETFIKEDPEDAVRACITPDSETALIVAAKMVGRKDFVEKLVEEMAPDDLALCDRSGRTALHRAAGSGNFDVGKLLVEKNKALPNMETNLKETALFYAAERGDRKMVEWLMEVTEDKLLLGERGFRILYQLTNNQLYDIALHVLRDRKNEKLATFIPKKEEDLKFHALNALAGRPSSFRSGNNFNWLQQLIYSSMKFPTKKNEGIEGETIADNHSSGEDIEAPPASNNSGVANGGWAYAVRKKLHAIISKVIETLFDQILIIKPIREIREKKLLHNQAFALLQFLCKVVTKDFSEADRIFQLPLEQATSLGIQEIIEEMLKFYPYAVYLENHKNQTIFQQAIVFRQEKVFKILIHQLEESTRAVLLSKRDTSNNNALHLAGYVAHPQKHNTISNNNALHYVVDLQKLNVRASAALLMQRELQWYKAVERLSPFTTMQEVNDEKKTPKQVFSDTHKGLVKGGEQWMKETANSCIIVASLIATVVFAAAIQVPGGNNDHGHPIFEQQTAFIIFGIANSLALYWSIVSVIMFLSIITSPYAEEEFLFDSFHGMIIGLGSLFVSILFTMIAFGAILYLMFGENKGWIILIPIVAFGFSPVFLFAARQYMWKTMFSMFFQKSNLCSNKFDIKT